MENYFLNYEEEINKSNRVYILIIYDVCDDKNRSKLVKYLNGYGYRVQKSAFEAIVTKSQYQGILKEIDKYIDLEKDSVRVYKINGNSVVNAFGKSIDIDDNELIII